MGFEYKINTILSDSEKSEIKRISHKVTSDNIDYSPTIEIEEGGIYICKYDKPDLWLGLQDLKDYLIKSGLKFDIEEL